jgi:DNA mismatch endonuclease (patch repair protein)
MADFLSQAQRSALMSRVKTRDTEPEVTRRVPGKPDIAWLGRRVAVFVDGAFWHGHPDHYWGQSGPFWDAKIARNRERDSRVNGQLAEAGWAVVRIWDFEVTRDLPGCVESVRKSLEEK